MDVGTIGWFDLTVPNADEVRDFYRAVVGWGVEECEMGGYSDLRDDAARHRQRSIWRVLGSWRQHRATASMADVRNGS
jgi:hypothetical protein